MVAASRRVFFGARSALITACSASKNLDNILFAKERSEKHLAQNRLTPSL